MYSGGEYRETKNKGLIVCLSDYLSPEKIAIPRPRFFPLFCDVLKDRVFHDFPAFLNFFVALHVHTVHCSVDRCEPLTSSRESTCRVRAP